MKDVALALVPTIPALVAAYLLYLQGMRTSERQSRDLADEREAEARRREQELEREAMRLREQGIQSAAERERERFAAFLRVVHQIRVGVENAYNTDAAYVFPPAERAQLAEAFEDLMLDASDELALLLMRVREAVSEVAEDVVSQPTAVTGDLRALDQSVIDLRREVRRHLAEHSRFEPANPVLGEN